MDVENNASGVQAPLQIIGDDNPQFPLMQQAFVQFEGYVVHNGVSQTETRIASVITNACAKAGNPILTRDQVNNLASASSPTDSQYLQQINTFAP